MTSAKKFKIIYLNQMAGPLFREIAEDLTRFWHPSLLYTGHPHTVKHTGGHFLTIKKAPEYNRSSYFKRIISWLRYFFGALFTVSRQSRRSLLFLVSNPPFLGLIGLLFKLIRGQKYIVLIYDIYPDILIGLGRIRNGLLARFWNILNRIVLENSTMVITIGRDMAHNLEKKFDVSKTDAKKVVYIPNWADSDNIRPIPKKENWFAQKYKQVNKVTVLYSGNMGNTHDIESILDAARQLSNNKNIHFIFIGEGAKWLLVQKAIKENQLNNVTLLPFQDEEVLPYSLSTGDIGIVSFQEGTETYMVPSKTYYYMAAGLALLVVSEKENELSMMVEEHSCGISIQSGDTYGLVKAILDMSNNKGHLEQYQRLARETAEKYCSRKNIQLYADFIRSYVNPF